MDRIRNSNVFRHNALVFRDDRELRNKQRGVVVWITGLSGSGKSTLAFELERLLHSDGRQVYVLDGDNLRLGVNSDLGFTESDRAENVRRTGEIAKLFLDAGFIVLVALISPSSVARAKVRNLVGTQDFVEVFCDCPRAICERRDVKGLYKKAISGEVRQFTGVSAPYEAPLYPEVVVNTSTQSLAQCTQTVLALLRSRLDLTGCRRNE